MIEAANNGPRAWTNRQYWAMIGLAVVAHFALVWIFGEKQIPVPRLAIKVPRLTLTGDQDELIQLKDPTLFALPQAEDFGANSDNAHINYARKDFTYREEPHWLAYGESRLGAVLGNYLATNDFKGWALDFKPEPEPPRLAVPSPAILPKQSTIRRRGELADRTLLTPLKLPDWPEPDVIVPSKVQVVVDQRGRVISTILLPPDYGLEHEGHDDLADQFALEASRTVRFSPTNHFTIGQLIFNWHVISPLTTKTNTVPARP